MKKTDANLVFGNWKSTPSTISQAKSFIKRLDSKINKSSKKPLYFLAVPEVFIGELSKISLGSIGSQNISGVKEGQTTGLVTAMQVRSSGADFSIIGHSEVRERGENLNDIKAKVELSLRSKMKTVLCVGEKERDNSGKYLSKIEEDLKSTLSNLDKGLLDSLIIAYEPIWAIGKDVGATPQECFEVIISIKRALSDIFGEKYGKKVKIIYGGTVNEINATSYIEEGGANGLLIGRSSQDVNTFSKIINSCHE